MTALATPSLTDIAELSDDAFSAVLGARRGTGLTVAGLHAARQLDRFGYAIDALWRPGRNHSSEDFAAMSALKRAAVRSADGMEAALAALNGGAAVLARDGWERHPLAGWLLRDLTNAVAVSYVKHRRAELDELLSDLRLDECSTQVALSRTTTSIATAMRKRYTETAKAQVAAGALTADWLADQAQAEFHAAAVVTLGRMAHVRSGAQTKSVTQSPAKVLATLADLHNIEPPKPARCRKAIAAWLDSPPAQRKAAALAALAGR